MENNNVLYFTNPKLTDEVKIESLSRSFLTLDEIVEILKAPRKEFSMFKFYLIDRFSRVISKIEVNKLLSLLALEEDRLTIELKLKLISIAECNNDPRIVDYFKR